METLYICKKNKMKDLLKEVILEQKVISPEPFVDRHFPENLIKCKEIIIISGIRRCGKSVLLQQIRNTNIERDYYINFDDERLIHFKTENFRILHEVFIELFGEQSTFYFDEIQNIPEWERFVRRLYDAGNKIYLTGSNASLLSKELGTRLTGRNIPYELYPFSFSEYLSFRGMKHQPNDALTTKGRALLSKNFQQYLTEGGFPQFLHNSDNDYLKALYENILYRDVMVRNNLSNEREIIKLVTFLASNTAKLSSNNSLTVATGIKSPTTIKNYISYLADTYLLFQVNKFDYSLKKQIQNPKKTYFIDNALTSRLGFNFSGNTGRYLENLVFIELKRRKKTVFYHSDKHECDFVVRDGNTISEAIQVSYDISDTATYAREMAGLSEAMNLNKLSSGLVITANEDKTIVEDNKTIRIVPAWKWLLEKENK